MPFTVGTPGVTVGTGPYKLTSFTPDQEVQVEANPDYFKGAPEHRPDRVQAVLRPDAGHRPDRVGRP
ncbi:MAG: ABC transporter substrate-binding protein [Tetrasphaera sp.]